MFLPIINKLLASPEVKGIRGSDKRKFILDLARLSPRDANWVGENDEYLCCLIRPELISHFVTAKNLQNAKEHIKQEIQDKDKKEEASKAEVVIQEETKGIEGEQAEAEKKGLTYLEYINKIQEYLNQNENKNKIRFNPNIFTRAKLANANSPKIEGKIINFLTFLLTLY